MTEDARKLHDYMPPWARADIGPIEGAKVEGGTKNDTDKPPLHLIPPEFLYAVAEILRFGANKYAPRNWERGINYSRVYRAAIGHLGQWFARRGPDKETGKSHLWHAACCVMFLVCYELWGMENFDDRPPERKLPGELNLN